ncbi:MAG: amidase [Dehalococcoidia bacterium]|nr:amidase [Dehalococcoidia bacterium]
MQPWDLTVAQAARMIRSGELSPVALMESLLEQIRRLEPSLKAWVTLDAELALAAARSSERELKSHGPRGVLHGVPVGIKDIYYTKGILTTACAPQYASFVPTYDATSVARLKAAGAIILGKAVTTQFAATDPSPTFNPWNPAHTPGGSSSGSAVAVASRMCPAALGSQTVGSTLRPAAYNGIVGLKPTYGRVSKYGVIPLAWSLDTVGILARSVEDAALLLQVMAGHDDQDPSSSTLPVDDYLGAVAKPVTPPRIGLVREFFYDHATEEVQCHTDLVVSHLRSAGAAVREVGLPKSFHLHEAARAVVFSVEAAAFHQQMFAEGPTAYGPLLRRLIEAGSLIAGVDYIQAQRVRRQFRNEMEALLAEVDVLLTPATPSPAPRDRATTGDPLFQGAWTSCGLPCVAIPSGLSGDGMPLGVQLASAPFAEARLLAAAQWCEAALGVTLMPPVLE